MLFKKSDKKCFGKKWSNVDSVHGFLRQSRWSSDSRHCVVAEAAQVRILVWTDNFLLNRFLEEEAHKQTIEKQLKLLKSMKKYPNKKQYNLIVEKLYHVVEQMLSKPLQERFVRTGSNSWPLLSVQIV